MYSRTPYGYQHVPQLPYTDGRACRVFFYRLVTHILEAVLTTTTWWTHIPKLLQLYQGPIDDIKVSKPSSKPGVSSYSLGPFTNGSLMIFWVEARSSFRSGPKRTTGLDLYQYHNDVNMNWNIKSSNGKEVGGVLKKVYSYAQQLNIRKGGLKLVCSYWRFNSSGLACDLQRTEAQTWMGEYHPLHRKTSKWLRSRVDRWQLFRRLGSCYEIILLHEFVHFFQIWSTKSVLWGVL